MSDCPPEVCEALKAALPEMPLFPLGSTVLFPHTLLPLHIFEPRYREMTRHALDTHKIIAIVQCDRDENVAEVAGVGRIVHHELLPDGRYHILLQGIGRVRLEEELHHAERRFRSARASFLKSDDDDETARALHALKACYDQLRATLPQNDDSLGELIGNVEDPGVIADVVCAAALSDPAARQRALAETHVASRLDLATEGLADLLLNHAPEADVVH
jgi:Lon protease-like protein